MQNLAWDLLTGFCFAPFWWENPFDFQTTLLAASVWEDSLPESRGQVLLAPTLQFNTEAMPGSLSLVEQQWPRPLALPNLPSRSLAWGRAAGNSCFSVTPISRSSMPLADANLAPSTAGSARVLDNTWLLPYLFSPTYDVYLSVLLDSHLSWKYHIDNVALKTSTITGVIVRLRHLVPFTTLLSIYRSLILPYLPNPIYKKSSCYKNVPFGWCISVNPERMRCLYSFPQKSSL